MCRFLEDRHENTLGDDPHARLINPRILYRDSGQDRLGVVNDGLEVALLAAMLCDAHTYYILVICFWR